MLYRFEIELSDIDRGIYQKLDFRANQHQSEAPAYLLTRALAYALSFQEYLEFSPGGLAEPEQPALWAKSLTGAIDLWIEVGNPSPKKLHRASKAAAKVEVYTYKRAELLLQEMSGENIHRANEIKIYAFDPKFLAELESHLQKNNRWTLLRHDGRLNLAIGGGIEIAADLKEFKND
jgi:uncharacterized protein YaeQ